MNRLEKIRMMECLLAASYVFNMPTLHNNMEICIFYGDKNVWFIKSDIRVWLNVIKGNCARK